MVGRGAGGCGRLEIGFARQFWLAASCEEGGRGTLLWQIFAKFGFVFSNWNRGALFGAAKLSSAAAKSSSQGNSQEHRT